MTHRIITQGGRQFSVGGRHRPKPGRVKLQFGKYAVALPTPPASVDYSTRALNALAQMYLNNSLGDCVIAGGYHCVGVWTGNATGTPFIATNAEIIADYSAIGGYVPGNPSTDNGCDEDTAEAYWKSHGFADGSKLLGSVAVDATNQTQVMQAIDLFENVYLGLELPDSFINPFPSSSGFTWNTGTPDPNNGHCVIACGYGAAGILICTWGMIGTLTWAGLAELCVAQNGGQLSVMLSPDMIAKGYIEAPNGFLWTDLITDFNAMGGNVPVPAPTPAPTSPPTAAQAIAAVKAAFQANHALLTRGQAESIASNALAPLWP